MKHSHYIFRIGVIALFAIVQHMSFAQPPKIVNDTLPPVHDPVIIKENNTYYVFATGRGITVLSSPDMKHWTQLDPVFDKAPAWAAEAIPSFRNHIWAPDISFHNGRYYLYYAV